MQSAAHLDLAMASIRQERALLEKEHVGGGGGEGASRHLRQIDKLASYLSMLGTEFLDPSIISDLRGDQRGLAAHRRRIVQARAAI